MDSDIMKAEVKRMKRLMSCLLMLMMLLPAGMCDEEYDVDAAIGLLKTCWREEYASMEKLSGYLEIKNTRIVKIADEPKADESVQEYADKYFGDVDYIVEFMLYSDLMGMAPYYQDAGMWDCVIAYEDGSMEVAAKNVFYDYRARTYSFDISGIVADVIDLNQQYNEVCYLMREE